MSDKSEENQSSNILQTIVTYAVLTTVSFGLFLEVSCLILFIYHFIKKTSVFSSKYFYLLAIGYVIAIVSIFFAILNDFVHDIHFINFANIFTEWYFNFFLGPWNTILALNRCTALLFWQKHSSIWSEYNFFAIIGLILGYPLLSTAAIFIIQEKSNCFISFDKNECANVMDIAEDIQIISNGINICASTFLGIITALFMRLKVVKISRDTSAMESHLLIQSILSSLFFAFYCIFYAFVERVYDDKAAGANSVLATALMAFSNFYCLYYHMSSTLLLFCLSDTVRNSFVEFYCLNRFKFGKKKLSTRVAFITSFSPT